MKLNRRFLLTLAVLAVGAIAFGLRPSGSQAGPVYVENGIAIDGTDTVAYFTEGRPVAGDPEIFVDWSGARWLFSSAANRALFQSDPEAYAPQFGGYCAWAVSEGYTASTDPEAWKIVNGKLYLNYSRRIQNKWEADMPDRITRGNENWPKLKG